MLPPEEVTIFPEASLLIMDAIDGSPCGYSWLILIPIALLLPIAFAEMWLWGRSGAGDCSMHIDSSDKLIISGSSSSISSPSPLCLSALIGSFSSMTMACWWLFSTATRTAMLMLAASYFFSSSGSPPSTTSAGCISTSLISSTEGAILTD